MLFVLGIAAGLWGLGHVMGMPRAARWPLIGLLYLAVLSLHVLLPEGHALREMTGKDAALWLGLGGAAGIVLAYRAALQELRRRIDARDGGQSREAEAPAQMSEAEVERYARHIMLREIGGPGQMRLRRAKVLVVGAGGLGAPAILYLAGAGVGQIGIIDDDLVEVSNLQRQIIHRDASLGMPKVFSAQAEALALNPHITVKPYHRRLEAHFAPELIAEYDLVLDGTDNFDTRYLVNAVCVAAGIPLISGALSQWEGQMSVFDPAQGAPCYRCIFPEAPADGLAPSCAEAGVVSPLPGVIGAMMAVEAVKVLSGAGTAMRGQMAIYDALYGESRSIALKRRADCPDCGQI
ncbi:molybdopterin-synthase adenylyltransferase MoeB [Alphaproteobacteria bacterium KMM 3653]|uniref:Molybdopterin-synthase adenylyltransferase n=1 Tax=Harenicola maris TaxID=2841044 RepID=A0AAP2CMP1_9RHOB|nr:molybdopterin-synthase adenylyltransferase MoeB [Harenicola maris]